MLYMTRMEMLDTFCIFFFVGLKSESWKLCQCHILHWHVIKYCRPQMGVSLAELSVNGQDLWVANKGKSQDGDGVCRLWRNINTWVSIISSAAEPLKIARTWATERVHFQTSWPFGLNVQRQSMSNLHLHLPVSSWWTCVGSSGNHRPREPDHCCTHGHGSKHSDWEGLQCCWLRTPRMGRESETSYRLPVEMWRAEGTQGYN